MVRAFLYPAHTKEMAALGSAAILFRPNRSKADATDASEHPRYRSSRRNSSPAIQGP
jgi:hypothetical protein